MSLKDPKVPKYREQVTIERSVPWKSMAGRNSYTLKRHCRNTSVFFPYPNIVYQWLSQYLIYIDTHSQKFQNTVHYLTSVPKSSPVFFMFNKFSVFIFCRFCRVTKAIAEVFSRIDHKFDLMHRGAIDDHLPVCVSNCLSLFIIEIKGITNNTYIKASNIWSSSLKFLQLSGRLQVHSQK